MGVISKLFGAIRRAIASSERDRLDEKLTHLDERIDGLENSHVEVKVKLDSILDINLANTEALEQKLNASKAGQEHIMTMFDLRFGYVDKAVDDIKSLIRNTCNTR